MRDFDQMLRNVPGVILGRHPATSIEPAQVYGASGIAAEGALAFGVEVVFKVADCQFAQGAVDGFAVAEAAVVAFGNGAPEAVPLEEGEDVIIIVFGLQVQQEGPVTKAAEGRGAKEGAFHAVSVAECQQLAR